MLQTVVLLALSAAVSASISLACGSNATEQSTAVPSVEGVVVDSIAPPSGPLGSEITIRGSGFTSTNNDVGFSNPNITTYGGGHAGYLNELSSSDGRTLRFRLPDNAGLLLGVCAMSQLKIGQACPDGGLPLPVGDSEVFVANEHGESNHVTLSVSGTAEATPAASAP